MAYKIGNFTTKSGLIVLDGLYNEIRNFDFKVKKNSQWDVLGYYDDETASIAVQSDDFDFTHKKEKLIADTCKYIYIRNGDVLENPDLPCEYLGKSSFCTDGERYLANSLDGYCNVKINTYVSKKGKITRIEAILFHESTAKEDFDDNLEEIYTYLRTKGVKSKEIRSIDDQIASYNL